MTSTTSGTFLLRSPCSFFSMGQDTNVFHSLFLLVMNRNNWTLILPTVQPQYFLSITVKVSSWLLFIVEQIQILIVEHLHSCLFSTQNWELVSMPKKSNLKKRLKVVLESVLEVTFHWEVLPRIMLKKMEILQANGNAVSTHSSMQSSGSPSRRQPYPHLSSYHTIALPLSNAVFDKPLAEFAN